MNSLRLLRLSPTLSAIQRRLTSTKLESLSDRVLVKKVEAETQTTGANVQTENRTKIHTGAALTAGAGIRIRSGDLHKPALETDEEATLANSSRLGEDREVELDLEGTNVRRPRRLVSTLEDAFSRFETKIQQSERVNERDFVRTFDLFTRVVQELGSQNGVDINTRVDLTLMAAVLLRCCGKLMYDTPVKVRELLAGNLWTFLKEKAIALDISHYNSLIRVINENHTISDPQKILDEITAAGLTADRVTYQRLIHHYCIQGDIENATRLLEKMKELDLQLNESTFASLIIGYGNQENPPLPEEIFELMRSNGVEATGVSIAAAIISQVKQLDKNPKASAEYLQKLFDTIEKEDITFSSSDIIDLLDSLSGHIEKSPIVKQLFDHVSSSPTKNFSTRYRIMSALMKNHHHERASDLFWSQKPSQRSIENGTTGIYYIRLLSRCPSEFAIRECSKLKELNYNPKPFHQLFQYAAEEGNLTNVRAALAEMGKEGPLKCHFFWPLIAQAKDEASIFYALKHDLSPKMTIPELLDTFSNWVWQRFSENPMRLFELNKELGYDRNILVASFLNFCMQDDKITEAIKFISEAPEDFVQSSSGVANVINDEEEEARDESQPTEVDDEDVSQPRRQQRSNRPTLVGRLLYQIAEKTKDPSIVNKAWNMCKHSDGKRSSIEMQPLVKVHLLNNDLPGAIETFLKIAKSDRVTPCKSDLICHCLEKKDAENLQKIMNVSTEIHGEANSLFDLATCCLMNDKPKQAQKIFASPGFRVNPSRVYRVCQVLADQGKLNAMENFVNLARDMHDVNQDYLYQILLDAYHKTSNGSRALDLWNKMQEEEYQPSKRNLLMIARVLEKNNITVPFQKPTMTQSAERALR